MLVFLTSLRNPRNAADYDRVERLLARTLASLAAQTHPGFRIVIVANRYPRIPLPPAAEAVVVGFPPPCDDPVVTTGTAAVLRDKGTKLAVGLLAAARHDPDHVMVVDADDLVSRRIAGYVHDHPDADGWYAEDGYVYSEPRQVLRAQRGFHRRCGTGLITHRRLWDLPDLPLDADQHDVLAAFGPTLVRDLLGSHLHAVAHFAAAGRVLAPLPFPAAVWVTGTGENHSGTAFHRLGGRVTPGLAAEFGLPVSSRLTALRHAVPAAGVRNRLRRHGFVT